MDEHGSSWHCCQGTGKNHQTIFFSNQNEAALKAPISTPALQGAPAELVQPLLCPSYSSLNRRNFLSSFYLMAEINFCLPDMQQSLTNYYSAGNFRESDREQRGYQTNHKNSDGENIIMNNSRMVLNSELVSPHPIKSPLPCAFLWDVRHEL